MKIKYLHNKSCHRIQFFSFIVFFSSILSSSNLNAQRIFLGVGADVMATHYTHFYDDFFISKTIYKGFYMEQDQWNFDPFFGNFRLVSMVSYDKFTFAVELSELIFYKLTYTLKYPLYNTNQELVYANYISTCKYEETSLSPILGYSFYRGSNFNIFTETGFSLLWPKSYMEELQTDYFSGKPYWFTEVMLDAMSFHNKSTKYLIGGGIRNSKYSISLRYYWRMNKSSQLPNFFSYTCFSLTRFTGFSYLKKNKFYFE